MTIEQRNTILKMRKNNESFKSISQATGLGVSSVKMFCQRNNVCPDYVACIECGMPIPKKNKKFCSSICRKSWWNKHKKELYKNHYSFTCKCCNKVFFRSRNDHPKYCSHSCYINDRYHKEDNHEQ